MKIVHVCTSSAFSEIYAYQENLLSHYHHKMGHDVTVIASIYCNVSLDKTEPVGERVLPDGIKLVRLAPLFKNKVFYEHLQLVRGLNQAILKEKPDLLFVHAVGCFSYRTFGKIKKQLPELKIVFDNHADYINSLHTIVTKTLHKFIYRFFLVPSLVKITDWFYGVTPSRCDFLHDVYGIPCSKIKLLIMGADDEKMNIDKKSEIRKAVRERYSIRDNDFLVVTGVKIDKNKNINVLAHAVNMINREDVKLLIFGQIQEEMKSLFEKEETSSIIEIGWVQSDLVYQYFYAADLVVFPGLHSVLWEQAVASGVPCAFSKMDGFEHVLVNHNCILMDGKDAEYYESMIKEQIDNPIQFEALKRGAESPAIEQFYYSRIARQVLEDVGIKLM